MLSLRTSVCLQKQNGKGQSPENSLFVVVVFITWKHLNTSVEEKFSLNRDSFLEASMEQVAEIEL